MSVAPGKLETVRPEILLAFEQAWPRHDGTKEMAIRDELGLTPARFYQLLGRAARTHDGIAANPITARRVRERMVSSSR